MWCFLTFLKEEKKMVAANLVSLKEVSEYLPGRPHQNTVRRWILTGARGRKLKAVLRGGRWFTTVSDVEDFLSAPYTPIQATGHLSPEQIAVSETLRRLLK